MDNIRLLAVKTIRPRVYNQCLLDAKVTDGRKSVTGYSNLHSTNVLRRSQLRFNKNSFMPNMRQSEAGRMED